MRARIASVLLIVLLAGWSSQLAADHPAAPWFPAAPPLPVLGANSHRVDTVDALYKAAEKAAPGETILVADGNYPLTGTLVLTADRVTLRSESGHRDQVVIDGSNCRHGEGIAVTGATDVTIANLTVANVKWNGIKINSDRGAERVTIHNCVLHNIWQRGVKAPAMPKDQWQAGPRDCRIQYCLFYNDRPKQFSDDETDTAKTFNGNYIGGIDVKNTRGWAITDNVFIGIQGRTREGRGAIYISENGRDCTIERNVFLDCDIAIALGNPTLGNSPLQAVACLAQNNFVSQCPETGILACYTKDCLIENNTIYEPNSRRKRLIWVQQSNARLHVKNNLLIGAQVLKDTHDEIASEGNVVADSLDEALRDTQSGTGQKFLDPEAIRGAIQLPQTIQAEREASLTERLDVGVQDDEVLVAMRKVHADFKGQPGYVAQFGDSITYSMAFWVPISWSNPDDYLSQDDGLPKAPAKTRWRDYVKGARDKGGDHANYSGWRVGQLLGAVDKVLERDKPEVAIIMIGTNDISGGRVPDKYEEQLTQVVQRCLNAHCVPLLNTIPPRRNHDAAVAKVNGIIRSVADAMKVPLVDFHAEIVRRRPDDSWQGTLISKDGVHPSGGKGQDFSEENLNQCGYALRNWVNFLGYRQIYFHVLAREEAKE